MPRLGILATGGRMRATAGLSKQRRAAMTVGGVFLPLAFAAGVVSFISPCVLPLVPGYLAGVTGAVPGSGDRPAVTRTLARSLWFLAGFLAVFLALGAAASALGVLLAAHRGVFDKAAGVFVIAMGMLLIVGGTLPATGLGAMGARVQGAAASRGGPAALGVAFAFCWTPCIGPVLASILALASTSVTLDQGVLLLLVYGLGLAVPFLLVALAFSRATLAFRALRRWYRGFQLLAGITLAAMGVLLFTNQLYVVNIYAQNLLTALHLNWWSSL